MKRIPLTHGKTAIVDDEDLEMLAAYKWSAMLNKEWEAVSHYWDWEAGRARRIRMHRLLTKCPTGKVVDHKNGNRLDNRRKNLRICTVAENNRNRRKPVGGTSRYKGVHWSDWLKGKPWCSAIWSEGRCINLGRYRTQKEAARAYDQAAIEYFGAFARCNFPLQVHE